jgi:hypothetical protein
MGLYRYSNEHENYPSYKDFFKEDKKDYGCYHQEDKKDHDCYYEEDKKEEKKDCDKKEDCDSESARALKKIISLLDDLNKQDLRILEDLIERLLCSRQKVY